MAANPHTQRLYPLQSSPQRSSRETSLPVIYFSYLRWGFVWQRPQHLLTRIADRHPVYVVEEPVIIDNPGPSSLVVTSDAGITILTPSLPSPKFQEAVFSSTNNREIKALLSEYFRNELSTSEVIAWHNTPMALGALPAELNPSLTVYDAMNDLVNLPGPSRILRDQERKLMRQANLVFTASPSLFEARKFRHPRTFCFPSGVEAAHFQSMELVLPKDLKSVPSPIIGYFGVLDDRIDFDLVSAVADARPEWSIVMIGPVVKLDRSHLAHRSNIHYLGRKKYDELPQYLAHFDAGMLPFSLNEATRFISSSKTLEYLAGGKPVVSTPIEDVVDLYEDVIEVASTPEEFVDSIERLWSESTEHRQRRDRQVDMVLKEHDWNSIASRMHGLMMDALKNELSFEQVLNAATIRALSNRTSLIAEIGGAAD